MQQNLDEYILSLFKTSEKNSGGKQLDIKTELATHFKNLIEKIPGGFFMYKANETEDLIYANEAVLRLYACSTYEEFKRLTGGSFKGMVHPKDLDEVEKSIIEQIEGSQFDLDYVEYRIKRADGVERWVEDYGHFIRNEDFGNIFYVFISDATEKIEQRIKEKKLLAMHTDAKSKKLKTLIEEYDQERKLINQAYLRRLEVIKGLSKDYESVLHVNLNSDWVVPYLLSERTVSHFEGELVGKKFSEFVAEYLKTWVCEDDRNIVGKEFSPEFIRKRLSGDNRPFYVNYRCTVNDEIQHIQAHVAFVGEEDSQIVIGFRRMDEAIKAEMHQKRLLEEALKNANQAANAKNLFLSNMSHDMRTPLNAIFGFTNLARKNINDPAAISAYLDKIENASTQLLELTDKVLQISDLESAGNALVETECYIKDVVSDICESFAKKAARKKNKLFL